VLVVSLLAVAEFFVPVFDNLDRRRRSIGFRGVFNDEEAPVRRDVIGPRLAGVEQTRMLEHLDWRI